MRKFDEISEIFDLTRGTSEGQARSRNLLEQLPPESLKRIKADLSALVTQGERLLTKVGREALDGIQQRAELRAAKFEVAHNELRQITERIFPVDQNRNARQSVVDLHVSEMRQLITCISRQNVNINTVNKENIRNIVGEYFIKIQNKSFKGGLGTSSNLKPDVVISSKTVSEVQQELSRELGSDFIWRDQSELSGRQLTFALARMENLVTATKPDVLVAVNNEGYAICRLIKHNLHSTIPIVLVNGTSTGSFSWTHVSQRSFASALVVGHVAWSGKTLNKVAELMRSRFRSKKVDAAVLATSTTALANVRGVGKFDFQCVTASDKVILKIDPKKLTIRTGNYRFKEVDGSRIDVTFYSSDIRKVRTKMTKGKH